MAQLDLQGTKFAFDILPSERRSKGFFVKARIAIENKFVSYQYVGEDFAREDVEDWLFSMFRMLAGGLGKDFSLSFEKAGVAVDFYPYKKENEETSREERRQNDCVMAIRLLMRDENGFLGGVYTMLLHKKEIRLFATALREEFYAEFSKFDKKKGKYLLVGVSPQGYVGCNYWYMDEKKSTKTGDYVWVRMGRRKLEQIVYVDCARFYDEDDIPYIPSEEKCILRKATEKEVEEWKNSLKEKLYDC